MDKQSRRRFLLLLAVAPLSGCQISEERLGLRVSDQARAAFFEAIYAFGRDRGYRVIEGENIEFGIGYQLVTLGGWRSTIWVDGAPNCGYVARFRNNDGWAMLLPPRDLTELKNAFAEAVSSGEGVEIADVSPARRACRVQ